MARICGIIRACLAISIFVLTRAQKEGEPCWTHGGVGRCTLQSNCEPAIRDMRRGILPQICSYQGMESVVCCPSPPQPLMTWSTPRPPVLTTGRRSRVRTTTEYVVPVYDYHINDINSTTEVECAPLDKTQTSPRTGRKAWDKCIEYQERLVYPCEKVNSLSADVLAVQKARVNHCQHDVDKFIIGGINASVAEFPHMALLGFSRGYEVYWNCGGTVISEWYILTAGHCTKSRLRGPVKYALVGILSRTEEDDSSKRYTISQVVKHHQYKSPVKYNDIALLKTETEIMLSANVVPACLHVDTTVPDVMALATGWGATDDSGSIADVLQRVVLDKFTPEECGRTFPPHRLMRGGFNPRTQVCYGNRDMSKDTCQGDSGGPLQLKNLKIKCMYTVVGVTSIGKTCGRAGQPGMYTKVAAFVPWIESVVWPEN